MKTSESSHQVGHFTIERMVHSSSEKAVYFAYNPSGTRNLCDAAVCQLHPNHRLKENTIALANESRLLEQLTHPAFPKLLQFYELEHAYAREWIDGVSVQELLEIHHRSKIPIQLPTIFDIMFRLSDVLLYLHQTAFVHGRLNWEHIFIQFDGEIRVIGLSTDNEQNIAQFSSPEQATNTFVDWRSDQWSLGALFACLLLKEPLYTGRPNIEYASQSGDVSHWIDRIRVTHPRVHRIVSKMLEPAAGERYQNPDTLNKALYQLTQEYPMSTRVQLAEVLRSWVPPQQVSLPVSLPTNPNSAVLPIPEPKMTKKFPDITELLEPEIEGFIEVTQHNTPILTNETCTEEEPEPVFNTEEATETDDVQPMLNIQSQPINGPVAPKSEHTESSLDTVLLSTSAAFGKSTEVQIIAVALIVLNAIVLGIMIFRYL